MPLSASSLQSADCGGEGAIEEVGVFAAIWHMSTKRAFADNWETSPWLL